MFKNYTFISMTYIFEYSGMVVVCAGCDAYYPWVGGALGIVAGCVYLLFSTTLVRLKIDDPLDASPIHLGAGTCQNFDFITRSN